ncbi:hypothetical protein GCM10012288_16610 [Malaciobacter pacificus]|nr:hypothetical protein [Malaciobacter pacificus]GGD42976.1 hypothetical protein GCM10012288_16610 [Malaciobacter pacificus]
MSKESISKIYLIIEKIEYIEKIVKDKGSISLALEDIVTSRPEKRKKRVR